MSATLASVATSLETAAGASTSTNPNEAGYWKRIATAVEALAGASTTANANPQGYRLRAAIALESIAGTSGAEENANESGYKKRIVDALEVQAGAVGAGSLDYRIMIAAEAAEFGGGETPQPDFANVVLLSAFDSDTAGVVDDESNSNHTITISVGASIDTSVKKFGAGSLLITAGTELCTVPDSDNWHFGAGAFTIEGWFNWSSFVEGSSYVLLSQSVQAGNQRTWDLSWTVSSTLDFRASSNGAIINSKATSAALPALTTGQWYHIAVDFDGTVYRIYLDGVMVASGGSPISLFNGTGVLRIGGIPPTTSASSFIGNIDEVRITKGEAVYASDAGFTPPTEAFPRS